MILKCGHQDTENNKFIEKKTERNNAISSTAKHPTDYPRDA